MSGEEPPEVEFLSDASEPGVDEELLPPGGDRSRVRRVRVILYASVVVLAASLLAARAATRHGRPTASPPTPTPSASGPIGGFGTGAPDSGSGLLNGQSTYSIAPVGDAALPDLPRRTSTDPTICPVHEACYPIPGVAPAVRAAILESYPRARIEGGRTIRFTGSPNVNVVWYREARARVGHKEVVVQVEAPRAGTADLASVGPRSLTYELRSERYVVRVRVAETRTSSRVDFGPLERLAGDHRLLSQD
jgi:hypothetical protein